MQWQRWIVGLMMSMMTLMGGGGAGESAQRWRRTMVPHTLLESYDDDSIIS
jgi:hypothetical protein